MPNIEFFKTSLGKCPIITFLDSLTGKQAQKITWVLEVFEETDIMAKQYFKKLKNTDDIWEIRVIYSGNIFRLLGFFDSNNIFILTNGFVKKTQKTPIGEIRIAEKRKIEYLKRKIK
ncbi:MAG: type II toxin-antitoxin system RelE/ParE family toxin [Ignavibacteriae bacterium]|nr:type II toxin-antitoxin system RelE/ParE family toxin [Ignavibacteriota bacterium]NOH00254.1 type II toxin-antitoxin system RelE/ParE family toxin [Ignavibacteriota bacterium]